jgi:hypothetical protein
MDVVTAQERRFGLKRLGTIINRTRHNPRPSDRAGSPEKRSRPHLNPLRRGTSTRDMQTIPSPQGSTINLPPPPMPLQHATAPTVLEPRLLQEPRREGHQPNGDTSPPPPVRSPSLSEANGTYPTATSTAPLEDQSAAPPGKLAEVRLRICLGSSSLIGTESA